MLCFLPRARRHRGNRGCPRCALVWDGGHHFSGSMRTSTSTHRSIRVAYDCGRGSAAPWSGRGFFVRQPRLLTSLQAASGIPARSGVGARLPTRFVHTSAASAAAIRTAGGAKVVPSIVFVKVGADGTYMPFRQTWKDIKDQVLGAPHGSEIFGPALEDVILSACTVSVFKNAALPAGAKGPVAALESRANFMEMEGAETLASMASAVGARGAPLFVRVDLPSAAATWPTFPALPPAITFTPVTIDGRDWFVTALALKPGESFPIFLTAAQHKELGRFIDETPGPTPQALMPVGTIKAGKSNIVERLLPGMITAAVATRWPSTRQLPVIFHYEVPLGCNAVAAAMHFSRALHNFGQDINVPFKLDTSGEAALDNIPGNICQFAERIRDAGGELWLLLDELQGPGLGSTPDCLRRCSGTLQPPGNADGVRVPPDRAATDHREGRQGTGVPITCRTVDEVKLQVPPPNSCRSGLQVTFCQVDRQCRQRAA